MSGEVRQADSTPPSAPGRVIAFSSGSGLTLEPGVRLKCLESSLPTNPTTNCPQRRIHRRIGRRHHRFRQSSKASPPKFGTSNAATPTCWKLPPMTSEETVRGRRHGSAARGIRPEVRNRGLDDSRAVRAEARGLYRGLGGSPETVSGGNEELRALADIDTLREEIERIEIALAEIAAEVTAMFENPNVKAVRRHAEEYRTERSTRLLEGTTLPFLG